MAFADRPSLPAALARTSERELLAGVEVFAQDWSRDPASPSHTSSSNAIRCVVSP